MQSLIVYSSAQVSQSQLACVFLGLNVTLRPIAALPASPPQHRPLALRVELAAVSQELVKIGALLEAHEDGQWLLDAGTEQGLRSDRDALQSRQRAIQATLGAQKGGLVHG